MKRSRGQALVEFALIIVPLLLIMMGIIDFGRAIFAYNGVSNGARAGMRAAIVDQNVTKIQAAAKAAVTGVDPADVTASYTPCSTVAIDCMSTVTVSYQWTAITPIIGQIIGTITLSSTTSMPLEHVYSSP